MKNWKIKLLTILPILFLGVNTVFAASFPTVESTSQGVGSDITLPSSIAIGDLVLSVFMASDSSTITVPDQWTRIANDTNPTGTRLNVMYYIATSTNTSFNIGNVLVWNSYRISGYSGAHTPEIATSTQEAGAAGDPPTLTPTWGSGDNLWISGMVRNFVFDSDCASGYANKVYDGTGGDREAVSCRKTETSTSDNPGTLTSVSTAGEKISFTIAVRGGSPSSSGNTMLMGMNF